MKSTDTELTFLKPLSLSDICNVNDLNNVSDIANLSNLRNLQYIPVFAKLDRDLKHKPLLLPPTWKQFIADLRNPSIMERDNLKTLICTELKTHNIQELHEGLYRNELEAFFVFTKLKSIVGKSIKISKKILNAKPELNACLRDKQLIDNIEVDMMTAKIDGLNYIFRLRKDRSENVNIPATLEDICKTIDTGQDVMDNILNLMFNIQARVLRTQLDVEDIKTGMKILNSETATTTTTTVHKSLYDSYNADETDSTSTEPEIKTDDPTVITIGDINTG